MRVHHKQPTLVSMWMLDVFCCALGCVTLLWLLNTRAASEKAEAAQAAVHELLDTQSERETVKQQLTVVQADLDSTRQKLESEVRSLTFRLGETATAKRKLEADMKDLTEQLAIRTKEKDDTARQLASTQEQVETYRKDLTRATDSVKQTETELKLAKSRSTDLEETLKKKQAEAADLAAKLATATTTAAALTRKLDEKTTAADETARKLSEKATSAEDLARLLKKSEENRTLAEKLTTDLQAKAAKLESDLREAMKDATAAKTSTMQTTTDLSTAQSQIKDLDKKLADARALIVDLQGDRSKLSDKFDRLQKDTESRFAGISMTGKRVVFMVDRSGSMDRTSEQVLAPTKWPAVAEAVAKVMKSLPNLEEFQVIVFSKQPQWLIGSGEWLPFSAERSPEVVKNALLKTKVEGDTNLFAAFDLAFRQRDKGMDTIYLFSDGLPTSGPGLTDELLRRTPPPTVSEQTDALARYVRSQLTTVWNRAITNQPKVRINSVGFFYESPDLGAFLWALSRDNDGSFVGMSRP